jgi:Aspartyl/Asparaginyl beta-hydroxylase
MKNFLLIGRGVNVIPLAVQILKQPQLWREDTYLRDYPQGPFKDVETIFLRFPPASVTELERSTKDQHECVWMDGALHLPAARPLIFSLMSQVEGERLGRVMLNRIVPGGRIYPHADTPVHAEYWDRFHYVVQTAPGVRFRCGDEEVQMSTGECWWFQNALEHEVVNNSASERIHLIIDIRTQHLMFKGELPTHPVELSEPGVEKP